MSYTKHNIPKIFEVICSIFFEHKGHKLKFFNNEKKISSQIYKNSQIEKKKITKKIRKYFELNYNENTVIYFFTE